MLAAALTFGLYVVGHFNADLKNFEKVVDSKPIAYVARALYYLLPNLAPLDVKSEVVHAVHVPAMYLLLNTAYSIVYVVDARVGCDVHLHAAGFQMTSRQADGARSSSRSSPCSPWRSRCRSFAIVPLRLRASTGTVLYVSNPRGHAAGRAVVRRAARGRVLDSRAAALRRRAPEAAAGAPLRPAVSAARSGDDARSAVYRRVSVRRDLSGRAAPRRGGAARPGDRAPEERASRSTRTSGTTTTTSDSSITGTSTTIRSAADWFGRGGNLPGAPFWLKTYAAVMLTRGGDRQASRVMWTQIGQNEESDWLRQTGAAAARAARCARSDRRAEAHRRRLRDADRAAARSRGNSSRARARCAGIPVDPSGVPYTLDPETGEIGVATQLGLVAASDRAAAAPELTAPAPPVPR